MVIKLLGMVDLNEVRDNTANVVNEKVADPDKEKVPFPESSYESTDFNCSDLLPDIDTFYETIRMKNWFNFYCS